LQKTTKIYDGLDKANHHLFVLNSATSLDLFESAWRDFLHHLERTWDKAEAHYGRSPRWSGWSGKYKALRSTDPLLLYVRQARNSEQHSVEEVTTQVEGGIRVGLGPCVESAVIDHLEICDGKIQSQDVGPGIVIAPLPSFVRLLPVTNRGRSYAPPRVHLGKPVNPDDVVEVAFLAIYWYRDFVEAAEAFFVQ
jgi:hypothetical protein